MQEAGDAPRIYWTEDQGSTGGTMTGGGKVNFENGFAESTLRALVLKRHVLGRSLWGYGGYQATCDCRTERGLAPASRARMGRRLGIEWRRRD